MTGQLFSYSQRVTYSLCTIGNHVYYSRYLDILEAARGEFFRHLGTSFPQWQQRGAIFPVIECGVRYKSAARYDDLLRVELWVTLARGIRMNFGYRMTNQQNVLILDAKTFTICTNLENKPKRLP